jgi:hypothetical protein
MPSHVILRHDIENGLRRNFTRELTRKRMMKRNTLVIGAVVAVLALGAGAMAVQAAPAATPSTDYRQVFIDKLAGILHKSSKETADGIKKASESTRWSKTARSPRRKPTR